MLRSRVVKKNAFTSVSKASREVATLTERKNPHTLYGIKELECLSVRLSVKTLTPIILGLAKQNGLKFLTQASSLERQYFSFFVNIQLPAEEREYKEINNNNNNYPGLHHSQGRMKFANKFHLYLIQKGATNMCHLAHFIYNLKVLGSNLCTLMRKRYFFFLKCFWVSPCTTFSF